MPKYVDICVKEVMVPKPILVVIGPFVWLTSRVIPYPVPAFLMLFIIPAISLGESFHNGLGQAPTFHTTAVIISAEILVGSFAVFVTHDTIVVDNDTAVTLKFGLGWNIYGAAKNVLLAAPVRNVLHDLLLSF